MRGKTGSLDGVSGLAGLIAIEGGRELVFAIIQNGTKSADIAKDSEDALLNVLRKSKKN